MVDYIGECIVDLDIAGDDPRFDNFETMYEEDGSVKKSVTIHDIFLFIWDRGRQIIKELSTQGFNQASNNNPIAIGIEERLLRFLLHW